MTESFASEGRVMDFFKIRSVCQNSRKLSPTQRFEMQYIPEPNSGCWLWIGAVNPAGYGHFRANGEVILAHRFSYQTHRRADIGGLFVLHICDMPACVNPYHLRTGTHIENMRDMRSKGRGKIGERNPLARLSEADVMQILSDTREKSEIAKDFGISPSYVLGIKARRAWKHIHKRGIL